MVGRGMISDLTEARRKVARGWSQGAFARSQAGEPVAILAPEACCFCAYGALYAVAERRGYTAWQALGDVLGMRKIDSILTWNDAPGRTQADVLALYDRAIAAGMAQAS